MDNESRALCNQLLASCECRTPQDVDMYLQAIAGLRDRKSPAVLRHLLRCLRDAEAGEAQYNLIEACEEYAREVYISAFTEEAVLIKQHAPWWFKLMFQSILNSEVDCQALVKRLQRSDKKSRSFFEHEIALLAKQYPQYQYALRRLRATGRDT